MQRCHAAKKLHNDFGVGCNYGVKHHEGSGDRRSIDSTIRGSWRHRAPSGTDVARRKLYGSAVDGGLKPHSDIDLLVTVTLV